MYLCGSDKLGNFGLFYINALIGIVGTLIISIIINKNELLQFLGKNSFFIMATHFPIRKPIILIFSKIINIESNAIYNNIFYSLICTFLTIIIEIILIKLINKTKFDKLKKGLALE